MTAGGARAARWHSRSYGRKKTDSRTDLKVGHYKPERKAPASESGHYKTQEAAQLESR